MQRRTLGATGLEVSVLGLGAGPLGDPALGEADAERLVRGALDLGMTLFDTAPSYGLSEARLGRFLEGARDRVVLSTKGGYGVDGVPDWTGDCIRAGVTRALGVLRTGHIDLLHLHSCPLEVLSREDVLRALEDVTAAGLVRVAAYSGENEPLAWAARSGRFGAVQCSVNLFDQRGLSGVVRDAAARGVGVIAKRPLANAAWRHAARPVGDYGEVYWTRHAVMGIEPRVASWPATAARFAAFAPGVTACIAGSRALSHLEEVARAIAEGPLPDEEQRRFLDAFRAHDDGWIGQI